MATGRQPTEVRVGPGRLYIAAVGATEPTDLTTAWAAAWTDLGYTEEGHVFNASPTFEPVTVAEEVDPISYQATGREMRVDFALAQVTAENLKRALNGGTVTTGTGIVTFEPPVPGAEVRCALGWQALDAKERWVWRKCMQTGEVSIARRKAPDKGTIPMSFMCEMVVGGGLPFKAIFDTTLSGTV